MIKAWTVITTAVALAVQACGQGVIAFNNFTTGLSSVTVTTVQGASNPADGLPGAFVGSNYSASLFFVNGTVTNQAAFDSLNPTWRADALFFGTTGIGPGHGFGGDLSGFFEGGQVRLVGQTDFNVTVQVRAWCNGGGVYSSYSQALAAGHNTGQSNLLPLYAPPPPGPVIPLTGLQPFAVGIPEPSTFLLAALGSAVLLLFRRYR